jgi:hypothetical protein
VFNYHTYSWLQYAPRGTKFSMLATRHLSFLFS